LALAEALQAASVDALLDAYDMARGPMRTTLAIDDALLAKGMGLTGVTERSALVCLGLEALIERESARRLARLGGSEPGLRPVPRRRARARFRRRCL
jgi:Arc/MetJ family transcription regulator